jgi:hypothetical protein
MMFRCGGSDAGLKLGDWVHVMCWKTKRTGTGTPSKEKCSRSIRRRSSYYFVQRFMADKIQIASIVRAA